MTVITDRRETSRNPDHPDPGSGRVQTKRGDEGRFYLGLVSLVAFLVFGAMAVDALLPMMIPGATSASITSGSMTPKLRVGDVVIAVDQGDSTIAIGKIVVFKDPRRGDLVTHRIVGVDPDGNYITKGDANGINDVTPVPPDNIRGVGRWVVPYVGLPRVWLAESNWFALLLTITTTATVLWFVKYAIETRYDPWRVEPATEQHT